MNLNRIYSYNDLGDPVGEFRGRIFYKQDVPPLCKVNDINIDRNRRVTQMVCAIEGQNPDGTFNMKISWRRRPNGSVSGREFFSVTASEREATSNGKLSEYLDLHGLRGDTCDASIYWSGLTMKWQRNIYREVLYKLFFIFPGRSALRAPSPAAPSYGYYRDEDTYSEDGLEDLDEISKSRLAWKAYRSYFDFSAFQQVASEELGV
eukprot:gb/GECG01014675.1/.p1 GENE.gb/GECG01014675.1/~~gb/GECG01014675.1/.p1  ORF type:complete len:206 (+),score=20.18 gb/GECG01014675.1/:1-618(+)